MAPMNAWPLTPLLSLKKCHWLPEPSEGRDAPVASWSTYSGGAPTRNIRREREPHSPTTSPTTLPSNTRPVAAATPKIGSAYLPSPIGLQSLKKVPRPVGATPVCQAFCIVVSKPVLAISAPAPKAAVTHTRLSQE